MLAGDRVVLRARLEADIPILMHELYDDVATRSTADTRPWVPIPANADDAPFSVSDLPPHVAAFSVVERGSDELAGEAVVWALDQHNRSAHLGISLRPAYRGRGLSVDVLKVLCHYAFTVRGLHRLQLETLVDNTAMRRAAESAGFTLEGTARDAAWVMGRFVDVVHFGQLAPQPAEG